jgi:hypothetical protein
VVSVCLRLDVKFPETKSELGAEPWGNILVSDLPRIGEFLDVEHDGWLQVVKIQSIHHFAVPDPLPETNLPNLQRKEPHTCLIGEWRSQYQWE